MTVDLATTSNPIVDEALARCGDIATLPEVTAKIIELVEDHNSSARQMHEVIKTDPALSARMLKVVNSAFYGLPGQIASVDRAIVLLGLSAVKNIAIAASVSRMFKGQEIGGGFTAKDLWKHSVAVAVSGRLIAKIIGFTGAADEVFLAGLIHNLGILVARQAFPEKLKEVVERCMAAGGGFLELQNEIIGADHQAFGAALTQKWKFPRGLRAVVGHHLDPEKLAPELRDFGTIIHLAVILCCKEKIGFYLSADGAELTDELLEHVQLQRGQIDELLEELDDNIAAAEATLATGGG
ncbi:MAG: HDOD domain-containing protein [Phycisphaerae bacterium]